MTLAALLRELGARGVQLWLDGDRIRYRGEDVPALLLAEARGHRERLRAYLGRRCEGCHQSRPIMVLMDVDEAPWWMCAACYRGALPVSGVA